MKSRQDYFHELIQDARKATPDTELQAALAIADGLNGVRKAMLDLKVAVMMVVARDQFPPESVEVSRGDSF